MKKITTRMILDNQPCYDPRKHIPEEWEGTPQQFLQVETACFHDLFHNLIRFDLIPDGAMDAFMSWIGNSSADPMEAATQFIYKNIEEEKKISDLSERLHTVRQKRLKVEKEMKSKLSELITECDKIE